MLRTLMAFSLVLLVLLASTAHAQGLTPSAPATADGQPAPTLTQVQAQQALIAQQAAQIATLTANLQAAIAAIPTPSTAVPPGPTPSGVAGSGLVFTPSNAAAPSLVRRATVITASDCSFTTPTWTTPLKAASGWWVHAQADLPAGATQTPSCDPTLSSITATGFSGKCTMPQPSTITLSALTAAATAGLTILPASANSGCAGLTVNVSEAEPAQ